MVEIVLHLIVLRQTQQVTVLHVQQILGLEREREIRQEMVTVSLARLALARGSLTLAHLMFIFPVSRDGKRGQRLTHVVGALNRALKVTTPAMFSWLRRHKGKFLVLGASVAGTEQYPIQFSTRPVRGR